MILRIDDTDLERNTEESLQSIRDGLKWLGLGWDERYRQSERLDLHRAMAQDILAKGLAYRDFTPLLSGGGTMNASVAEKFNPDYRQLGTEESDRRASAGEAFVIRYRVPRGTGKSVRFTDLVYGEQEKALDDIEDFALLRSNGAPTYHLASCADDADLRISHIIRGQDHLTNTFKHLLVFRAAGVEPPQFAHLPLLLAPDGSKLSKRNHGIAVSIKTYEDKGIIREAFINFMCLLGWSPKDDREVLSLKELEELFSFKGVNRSNAIVNFTAQLPLDAKAVALNAEHLRLLTVEDLAARLLPFARQDWPEARLEKILQITPLIRERIKLLQGIQSAGDFFFAAELAPYESSELIPKKGDAALALRVLQQARETLATADFTHDGLDAALRGAAETLGIKAGQMFEPIRVAACGRKTAPPLFGTLEVLGRETCLKRIGQAITKLQTETTI